MTKSSQSQKGSAFIIIIIILAVALVGVLGFVFWQNFISKGPEAEVVPQVTKKSDNVQKAVTIYNLESVGASFSYPSDWKKFSTYPNGVTLNSPDFSSESGFTKVSNGSIVTISSTPVTEADTEDAL